MILRAYKYRIYPNKKQIEFFEKNFGCVRFYWNKALEIKLNAFKENIGKPKEEREPIPKVSPASLKKDYPFLKEADSTALSYAYLSIERAFYEFLKGKKGIPKFKKKKSRQSYTTYSVKLDFEKKKIKLAKIKEGIKIKLSRTFNGKIKKATIIKTPTNKYFVSILVEENLQKNDILPNKISAIDLGLKDFAVIVDSEGNVQKISHPKWIKKIENKIIKEQRKLSKKQKGSKNREKQRLKLAKLYEKLTNQKEDFLHKLSKTIISENQAVVVEGLNVKGLLSNKYLSKNIADSSWNKFLGFLYYKAQFYDRQIIKVNTFYPSSKLCNVCNYKKEDLKLYDREWICPICKTKHDRDINAGLNLLKYGITLLKSGRAGTARTKACGDCSDGGMVLIPVYESSIVEAGSFIL